MSAARARAQEPTVEGAERVKRNQDGSLDELVVRQVETFHIEQMDRESWWIGLSLADGRSIRIDIWSKAAVYVRADTE